MITVEYSDQTNLISNGPNNFIISLDCEETKILRELKRIIQAFNSELLD